MEESVGPTPQISPEDASQFYRTTGIDITDYKELAMKCNKECAQLAMVSYIQYLKDLEEYMSLCLHDRVTVLKGRCPFKVLNILQ